MKNYKLALLGFGNVGQAFARLLGRKEDELRQRYQVTFTITGVATGSRGRAINQDGLDMPSLLDCIATGKSLDLLSAQPAPADNLDFIRASGADILFENTPVSYADGQPALDHIRTALNLGMHAITANKGPVVHGYHSLSALAAEKGVRFLFESTVMDGAPVFRMEGGESFEQAVAYAQSIGIAETDPSGDVDGWDASVKISALITVMMNVPFTPDRVERTGIRGIGPEQIAQAQAEGKRWKLMCAAWREDGEVRAKVAPAMVGPDIPAYTVDGTTSIVTLESDVLGSLSLIETNPSPDTTAYGLLADFLNAVK